MYNSDTETFPATNRGIEFQLGK